MFIPRLRQRLAQPLPGLAAQLQGAPPYRGEIMPATIPDTARLCAVLIPLYWHEEKWHTAFMRRAEDGYAHSGQVSFAGGGREPQDIDFEQTALREAQEELGISPEGAQVLGQLTQLYIPPSNSLVYPIIAHLPQRPAFSPDPKEVAYVIEAPLETLLHPDTRTHHPMTFRNQEIQMPAFQLQGNIIWGATAMMVSELLAVLEETYH